MQCSKDGGRNPSLDHLVGEQEEGLRNLEPERLGAEQRDVSFSP